MQRNQLVVTVSIVVTFILGAVASLAPIDWAWGLNHLQFLPSWHTWAYLFLATLAISVILLPIKLTALDSLVETTDRILWGEKHWHRVAFALAFIPIFYFLRVETYFLGDGYGWLGNLSHEGSYIQKWTEFGSLAAVRFIQSIIGSYSEQSALTAFQIISISSGVITVYNLLSIVGRLCGDRSLRFFGLILIVTSGVLLLFCGYVEVYPILWAAATIYINLSIRYLQENRGLAWVLLSFVASVFLHVQAVYFIFGLIWLMVNKRLSRAREIGTSRTHWWLFILIVIAGGSALFWVRTRVLELEMMILPLFEGRPASPDYAVFSAKHLSDIANLFILIFPMFPVLFLLSRPWRWYSRMDSTSIYLLMSGAGSILFLLVFDAVIGLARDWDLASLTILCPALLLLRGCQLISLKLRPRLLIAIGLLGLAFSGSYLAANTNIQSSENRFHGLLQYYGSQNYGGWCIYNDYLRETGRTEEADTVIAEMDILFPNEVTLSQAIGMMDSGDAEGALRIAQIIAEDDPYNAANLALIGKVYLNLNQFDKAEEYMNRALRISPYFPFFLNTIAHIYIGQQRYAEALEMGREASMGEPDNPAFRETFGLAYYYNKQLDSAELVAGSLLQKDSCASHSNLLMIMIAVARSDRSKAQRYYRIYKQCGPVSQEYQYVLRDFRFILEE